MAFTYDPTSDAGKVRLLCTDTDSSSQIFSDAEIDAFMALENNQIQRSAALALETIASDKALTLKVIRLKTISTDGAALSDALLKRAAMLRKQADDAEAREDGGAFDWAEMVLDDFGARERLWNQRLRHG